MGVHPGEGRLIAQAQTAPLAQSLLQLQHKIGIHFRDPGLLLEAVTHSSFANENPSVSPRDNERLEYLGDAVLQLIAAEYLYKHHPGATEGELTQTRSAMVNTNTLAQLAEELDLVELIYAFEENTGLEIPDEDAEKITTVGQAWEYIQEKAGS